MSVVRLERAIIQDLVEKYRELPCKRGIAYCIFSLLRSHNTILETLGAPSRRDLEAPMLQLMTHGLRSEAILRDLEEFLVSEPPPVDPTIWVTQRLISQQ